MSAFIETSEKRVVVDQIPDPVVHFFEAEPTFEEYEVPCRKDWVVLDGLNYIKDQLDGTLSFR